MKKDEINFRSVREPDCCSTCEHCHFTEMGFLACQNKKIDFYTSDLFVNNELDQNLVGCYDICDLYKRGDQYGN